MKPTRHQAREVALQLLYRYDLAHQQPPAPPAAATSAIDGNASAPADRMNLSKKTPAEMIDELNHHFDHFKVPLELRSFAAELVAGTLKDLANLDSLLEKHASNWKIGRMGMVDRNLLRMSIYEMSHFPDTPPSVVIDEAIELAKQFGTAESPAFINGVLDAVKAKLAR